MRKGSRSSPVSSPGASEVPPWSPPWLLSVLTPSQGTQSPLCKGLVELLERCFSYHSCDAALGANCDSFGGGSTVWMCRPQKVLIWGMYFSRELHFPFPFLILSSGESTFSGCELDLSLGLHLLQVRSLILSLGAPYFIALEFFRTTSILFPKLKTILFFLN